MVTLYDGGAYLLNGTELIPDNAEAIAALESKAGIKTTKEEAVKGTMAYHILSSHNTSGNMENLKIKFDKLTSHDITFVGILQTARALVFPVQKNMVVSMYLLIRQLFISLPARC